MKRILTLLLVLSMVMGTALPITVMAAMPVDNEELTMDSEGITSGDESDAQSATPTLAEPEGEAAQSDTQADPAVSEDQTDESDAIIGQSGGEESTADATVGIKPLSGFEWEDSEFFTRIRLTVKDRDGNPIEGAVYGLYRAYTGALVEELVSDRYGVVTSGDVPVDTDYYLRELKTPEGFRPNEEEHFINLAEICAPSRVDVAVVYDPIMGEIVVIKTDDEGRPIEGVGFYVYRVDGWELVDTLYTDSGGVAYTTWLPYSPNGYELYEFYAPEDFIIGGSHSVQFREDGETVELEITNYRASGDLRIYKSGTDDRKIQGATFSIYRAVDNEKATEVTTNSSGYAYAYDLPLGDYYAVETSVPSPYRLDAQPQYFSISYNGQWVYLNLVNDVAGEPGRLQVLKTDDSGKALSGVVFGLYRTWDNKKLGELTSGADGVAEYGPLIPQDYYLLEQAGKTGYTMITERIHFTVDGTGATVELTVVNPKIRIFGKVKVIKKDDAGAPIAGVRFGVYCHKGNLLEELVTASDGTATSGILNESEGYYLQELEGVAGHLAGDEKHTFSITENNVVVPVEVINPRITGGVRVIKTGDSDEPLSGVVFGVYRDGSLVEKLTTLEDGTAQSGTLYYGDHELRELSTVEGYELLDTPIPFSITEQDVVIEIPVTNPLIMGTITVIKVDDSGSEQTDPPEEEEQEADGGAVDTRIASTVVVPSANPLPGAVFGLYNSLGQKLAELVTGEDGAASYALPKGAFYLKELAAPEGFLLTDELIPFAIETQGQVVEKVVANIQGFGTVKVIKSGEALPGEEEAPLLSGVTFDVYRASDEEKGGELVTDERGEAVLELPLGRWYLIETTTDENHQLLPGRVSFTLTEDGATVELPIANQRIPTPDEGVIRLTKVNAEDGSPLADAVFGVHRAEDDERVGELISGLDGMASIALPASDYYLLEEIPPEGFLPLEEKIPATVAEGAYTAITVENTPEPEEPSDGELRVIKHAADTGERLAGAKFGVYNADTDEKVGEIVSNESGVANLLLPEGDFYLLEQVTPTGFKLKTVPVGFHITAGETQKLTIANEPEDPPPVSSGKVQFIKEAKDTKEKLAGAVIGVYAADSDVKIAELTTGSDGSISHDLAVGDYYWKELRSPEGFSLLEGTHTFSIAADKTETITVVNKALPDDTGTLLLVKKASGTGEGIADAVFGVYTTTGNKKVAEIATGDDGEAELALAPNSYYLRELSVPSPFVLEAAKIPFTIKESGQEVRVELSNTKGIGTLLLEKKSADGKALSGAVFTLYRQDGSRIAELTSTADGTVSYELPAGSGYYLMEKTAPAGFRLDTQRHSFSIRHKETSTVTVVNEPLQGTVEVYFKHVSDGRELVEMKSLTDKIGTDYIKWMREKGYENMLIDGYTLLRTDYPSSLVLIDGKLVVTLWYDSPAAPAVETDTPGGGIEVPKTGGAFPYKTYGLSLLCWAVAVGCGVVLFRKWKQPASDKRAVSGNVHPRKRPKGSR